MKLKILLFTVLLAFLSCSTSDDMSSSIITPDGSSNNNNNSSGNNGSSNSGDFTIAYHGDFVNSAHETSGVVKVNTDKTILKLENFSSENGPILELYLATDLTVQNYISLGQLQGLTGDFDYMLSNSNIDFSLYKYVIVWCVDFSVNFGYAILEQS